MSFNSLTFFVFFALFYGGYLLIRKKTDLRIWLIVIGSAIFYGWWDWRFLLLIFATGGVDFVCAKRMGSAKCSERQRKILLLISLIFDLGMLGIFKYSRFIAENLDLLVTFCGMTPVFQRRIPSFCLILPVGISFYTFQSLSYTIDVWRKRLVPTRNFVHYIAYLMFFPQLVAGPIVRAKVLLYQLLAEPDISRKGCVSGIKLIVLGFFKKCFLADNVAEFVNTSFAEMFACSSTVIWWGTMILFSIQIYCDFSGYSDIARGLARLLGYHFPLNFDHPYFARGFRDFWKRWHISLSGWFMDYVYIPLGGNVEKFSGKSFVNRLVSMRNLLLTMLLSGLWHGAAWNFILWGGVHGVLLLFERLTDLPKRLIKSAAGKIFLSLSMLFIIPLTWVFFRAGSVAEIRHIFYCMFHFGAFPEDSDFLQAVPFLIFFIAMELWTFFRPGRYLPPRYARGLYFLDAFGFALLAGITLFFRGSGNEFIYFQF